MIPSKIKIEILAYRCHMDTLGGKELKKHVDKFHRPKFPRNIEFNSWREHQTFSNCTILCQHSYPNSHFKALTNPSESLSFKHAHMKAFFLHCGIKKQNIPINKSYFLCTLDSRGTLGCLFFFLYCISSQIHFTLLVFCS